jgi:hypothetical protein
VPQGVRKLQFGKIYIACHNLEFYNSNSDLRYPKNILNEGKWQFQLAKIFLILIMLRFENHFNNNSNFLVFSPFILNLISKNHVLKGSGIPADQIPELRLADDQKYLPELLHN